MTVKTRRLPSVHQAGPAPSVWRWAAIGLVIGLLGSVVAFAPAAWLSLALSRATQGQLVLADARGTVWNGSAQLVFTGGEGAVDASVLPGRVDWRLRPVWLGARAQVSSSCCSASPAQIAVRPGLRSADVDIQSLQLQLPASVLTGLGTPWNTMDLQGQLRLAAPQMQVALSASRLQLSGDATLDALQISSRLSTLRPLGDYRLSLVGGETPRLALQTLQGALQLSGSGQLVGGRMRFAGEASAAPERQDALGNLLNIIGRRQGPKSIISLG